MSKFNIELLTLNEVSALLKVSKSYLYKLTSRRKIPFYKPSGKLIYFEKSEVEKWITDRKVITTEEFTQNYFLTIKDKRNG